MVRGNASVTWWVKCESSPQILELKVLSDRPQLREALVTRHKCGAFALFKVLPVRNVHGHFPQPAPEHVPLQLNIIRDSCCSAQNEPGRFGPPAAKTTVFVVGSLSPTAGRDLSRRKTL